MSALAIVLALVVTGCGNDGDAAVGDGTATDELAQSDVESEAEEDARGAESVAAGELTAPGTTLGPGETATLLEVTSDAESVVEAAVNAPRIGDISDLADYELPDSFKDGVPHYVDISVRNVGDGDLANGIFRGVHGITNGGPFKDGQVVVALPLPRFDTCGAESYPSGFTNGASVDTCLIFMVPEGDTLTSVRRMSGSREEADAISWEF